MALAHETLLLQLQHPRLLEIEIETKVVFGQCMLVLLGVREQLGRGGGSIEGLLPREEVGVASHARLCLMAEPKHLGEHFGLSLSGHL